MIKEKLLYLLRYYPLSLFCLALIWMLCLFIDMPESSLNGVPFIDKWTHFVMYGGTCSVIWWEYTKCHREVDIHRVILWAFIAPILMSGVIELLQAYCTTTRRGEWLDLLANTVGVVLGNVPGFISYCFTGTKNDKK